ncbi:MAG: YczE/YyaS/YitT family protein [Arachnia sp.]
MTQPQTAPRSSVAQYAQLVIGCTVLGIGVAMVLTAELGSDGYSTLVSGLTILMGLPFWLLNTVVGAIFVGVAWLRGRKPGPGTLVQWFLVGFVISFMLEVFAEPGTLAGRGFMLVGGLVLVAMGVAAYLASNTGAGPAEAMALSFDPPLPFRWSYSILQLTGALAGWLMGASVGPGTVLIFLLMGPAVDLIRHRCAWLEFPPLKMVA